MPQEKVLVLGVGNILLGDDGIGVHAIRLLTEKYDFHPNVSLMDGGTLGLSLMDYILQSDVLIVIDAVRAGHTPGSVYRLEEEGLRQSLGMSDSMHQMDLVDTLIMCELSSGKRPEAIVFGVEPKEIAADAIKPELSESGQGSLEKLCGAILEALEKLGYPAKLK